MLKLCENPPMLFPAVGSLRELIGPWRVAHTRPRNEKALAWDLLELEIPFFLPMARRTLYGGGRKRFSMLPLFPSYVFVAGDDEIKDQLLRTNRTCALIGVDDQQQLIAELSTIERAINQNVPLDPCPQAVVGRMMRVSRGPFRDIVGTVIRRDSITRLMMQVSILGRAIEMDIEADLLEPVE